MMRIFEGAHRETAKDITFMYNADFFLYASLHHGTDSHGNRVTPNSSPPVLTGMPVSSMILLDRPEEAGYFIFSDLSVRHEGRYYLTFALMEEVKEDRDKDPDEQMAGSDEITGPDVGSSGRHFSFRTTAQTDMFDVYSAKKFPGLMESTALSRTVAEQGCRVRIRRDVRMRRREKGGKGSKEGAPRGGENHYAQKPRVEAAPQPRGRSSSNDTSGTYHAEIQRRQSGMDYTTSRPSFAVSEPSRQPPYGQAAPYAPHAQSLPNSPSYPPPPPGSHYAPRPSYPYTAERPPSRAYGPPPPRPHRESYSYQRPSAPILAPKLEPDPELVKPKDILPPIRAALNGSAPEPRRPSFSSQPIVSMPRLLPQPAPQKRDPTPPEPSPFHHKMMNHQPPTIPPFAGAYERHLPSPPTPITPSVMSRKRTADEAFAAMSDSYRLQNGRREDEQPRDANYKVEQPRYSTPAQEPEMNWHMSNPWYARASDNTIPVDFTMYGGPA